MSPSPFALPLASRSPWAGALVGGLARALERAAGLRALGALYASPRTRREPGPAFFEAALDALGIGLDLDPAELDRVPATGPLIVLANHPSGIVDGLAVTAAVGRRRADVAVVCNRLLARVPEAAPCCLAVDVYGGRAAVMRNAVALRRAVRWVRDGHALVVFPAGNVDPRAAGEGVFVDRAWHRDAARLVAMAGAPVLPMFVTLRPSRWLRAAGHVHWALRTATLPRELLRLRGRSVGLRIGRPLEAAALAAREAADDRIAHLHARTHALAPTRRAPSLHAAPPTIAAADPSDLEAEFAGLPSPSRLVEGDEWLVVMAEAAQLPCALPEIGRLREVTFRAAGEGSGRAVDLDAFDRDYLHLIAWHRGHRRIAGAYRVGPTDRVAVGRGGPRLYTRTLFRYGPAFTRTLGPALELGRAFVHPDHQRDYATLMMLWKGIGAFVARHPRYRRLFGPVSLSADLPLVVRQVLVEALRQAGAPATPASPAGRRPFAGGGALIQRLAAPQGRAIDHEALDALVRDLDPAGRPMPVLLRHYLKLGGRVLAFSVDPSFGGVVDGFMVVDLAEAPAAALVRYMGRGAATSFLAFHQVGTGASRPEAAGHGDRATTASAPQPA